MYASDKNQVYILLRYDIPVLDHNKFNYEVFRRNGIIQYPFYNIIPGADPKEGNQIDHPFYLVQSGGVWYKGVKLEEADPSAEILYYGSEYFVQDE
ncbi:MAG: hypothetical protein LBO09_05525 [Candidatus Peribacteria bacterium]|nr:hypothetical protein [Candidatus Peribacteria bacterium]